MQVDSGKVMSAMTNWLIGDLEKGNKVRLNAVDGNVGDRVDFTAQAGSQPTVVAKNAETMETPKVTVTRSGLNAYSGYFLPRDSGFYSMRAQGGNDQDMEGVAVNFPTEYMELGADDETLRRMAADGGGKLYDESNVDALIDEVISRAKLSSTKEVQQSTDLWEYFAGAALLVYFLDAAGRRVNAIFKRGHEE
jgi:imidazole glycerol phosphate synthase subunit HisF